MCSIRNWSTKRLSTKFANWQRLQDWNWTLFKKGKEYNIDKKWSKLPKRKDLEQVLITAWYYSILYYNSEVWLLPTLSPQSKQKLISAFAAPLKLTTVNFDRMMSYDSLPTLPKPTSHPKSNYKLRTCPLATQSLQQWINE